MSAAVNRDIVYACTGSCDSEKIFAEFHIVHLSAANHDRIGLFAVI